MTKNQLENKYGIKIVKEDYFEPYYKIYTADGCLWENGLYGLKSVEKECREWEKQLLDIKNKVEKIRGGK